jgi:hypothetical protein
MPKLVRLVSLQLKSLKRKMAMKRTLKRVRRRSPRKRRKKILRKTQLT